MYQTMMKSRSGRIAKGAVLGLSMLAFAAPEAMANGFGSDGVQAQKLGAYQGGSLHEQGLVEQVHGRRRWRRRRNRGAAIVGGVIALGALAAIANAGRHSHSHYGPRHYSRGGNRCNYWADRCADNWGYRNSNFYGCLRYHGC